MSNPVTSWIKACMETYKDREEWFEERVASWVYVHVMFPLPMRPFDMLAPCVACWSVQRNCRGDVCLGNSPSRHVLVGGIVYAWLCRLDRLGLGYLSLGIWTYDSMSNLLAPSPTETPSTPKNSQTNVMAPSNLTTSTKPNCVSVQTSVLILPFHRWLEQMGGMPVRSVRWGIIRAIMQRGGMRFWLK